MTGPEDPLRADLEWPDPSKPNRGYSQPGPGSPGSYRPPTSGRYADPGPAYGMPVPSALPAPRRSRGLLWLFVIVAVILAAGIAVWAIWF